MVVILLELHTFVVIFLWNRCWYKTSKSYLCVFVPALCHDVLNETFWNIKFYSSQLQLSYNLTMSVCPKTLRQPGDFIKLFWNLVHFGILIIGSTQNEAKLWGQPGDWSDTAEILHTCPLAESLGMCFFNYSKS